MFKYLHISIRDTLSKMLMLYRMDVVTDTLLCCANSSYNMDLNSQRAVSETRPTLRQPR